MKLLRNIFKTELLLSIIFLIVPFLLPLTSGVILGSISAYAYATNANLFLISLTLAGYLITVDGLADKNRRYNIILGLLLIFVPIFPVGEFRVIHDIVAILFFIGNAIILSYHNDLIPKIAKIAFVIIIIIMLVLFLKGIVSLFVAESIGFLLMSVFMFIRYLKVLKNN